MDYVFLILLLDIPIEHDFVAPPLTIENHPGYYALVRYFKIINVNLFEHRTSTRTRTF